MTQNGGRRPAATPTYDAVLVASFGGPETPEQVMPFLKKVASGRNIPQSRLEEVEQHYLSFNGYSPINDQNRALVAALTAALAARGLPDLPVVLGNRNSPPFFDAVLEDLHRQGRRRVLSIATSMYASYSSCRQYREDLAQAVAAVGHHDLEVVKVRPTYDQVGLIEATEALLRDALGTRDLDRVRILFTTHSIPLADAHRSGVPGAEAAGAVDTYSAQHRQVAARVMAAWGDGAPPWRLVYQSRSGPPHIAWLEPDISDALVEEVSAGAQTVVVVPIGFVSDHIEVIWDLDTEAQRTAAKLGVELIRVPTVGVHPLFVSGLADLIERHVTAAPVAAPQLCGNDCCVPTATRPTVKAVDA